MIYHRHKYCFVHIPRTSGISISRAVMEQPIFESAPDILLGDGFRKSARLWRHSRAAVLSKKIDDWWQIQRFAVMRNPWRIVESTHRHFQDLAPTSTHPVIAGYAGMGFSEFTLNHFVYLKLGGGFWTHWCLGADGEDLGVEPLRFESLNWKQVCDILGFRAIRPMVNHSQPHALDWTSEAESFIRERCSGDISRFGYSDAP